MKKIIYNAPSAELIQIQTKDIMVWSKILDDAEINGFWGGLKNPYEIG